MSARLELQLSDADLRAAATCAEQLARMWECDVTQVTVTTTREEGGTFAATARGPAGRCIAARRMSSRARAIAGITPAYSAACTLYLLDTHDALVTIERALVGQSAKAQRSRHRAALQSLAARVAALAEELADDGADGPDRGAS